MGSACLFSNSNYKLSCYTHKNMASRDIKVKQQEPVVITPAEETPKGFYFLSNLDQNFPFLVRTIYCFKSSDEAPSELDPAQVIKTALSKVLVHYYPLAGRLTINSNNNKFCVDCTAEGAVFVEAEADCSIEHIRDLTDPDAPTLDKLFYDFPSNNILDAPLLIVQVTKFLCGGFTFGLSVSHNVVDGIGGMGFMDSWAEIARGLPLTTPPFLDRTILKARDPPSIEFEHHEFAEIEAMASDMKKPVEGDDEEIVFKSFCFEAEKLRKLKRKVLEEDGGDLKSCTTFEALSGLVWRARTEALGMNRDQKTRLLIPVDGRSKFEPSIPKGYLGNAAVSGVSVCRAGELVERPVSYAVGLVQKQVKRITDGYMRSVIDYSEVKGATYSFTETVLITNWSRLSFHTTDFGWGEPVFTGPGTFPQLIIVFLCHGERRNGINVLLNLPASAMQIFQQAMHF